MQYLDNYPFDYDILLKKNKLYENKYYQGKIFASNIKIKTK